MSLCVSGLLVDYFDFFVGVLLPDAPSSLTAKPDGPPLPDPAFLFTTPICFPRLTFDLDELSATVRAAISAETAP